MVKSEALCKRLIKYQWLIWPHSVQFSSVFKYNRGKKQTLRQYGRNCLQRKLRHTRWTNIWLQDWSSRVWTIWSMETISASHNLDKKKYVPWPSHLVWCVYQLPPFEIIQGVFSYQCSISKINENFLKKFFW